MAQIKLFIFQGTHFSKNIIELLFQAQQSSSKRKSQNGLSLKRYVNKSKKDPMTFFGKVLDSDFTDHVTLILLCEPFLFSCNFEMNSISTVYLNVQSSCIYIHTFSVMQYFPAHSHCWSYPRTLTDNQS